MMDRSPTGSRTNSRLFLLCGLMAVVLVSTTGCLHTLLATGIYVFQGGATVDAQCDALEGQRVVVICRPPSSNEYRHAGAAREIGKRVSLLLKEHVPRIDVVSPREVDNWIDEQDWDNYKDLGRAVKANRVVYIELDNFDLYKGSTLYQGDAMINLTVYDMDDRGEMLWEKSVGQILFPRNSGIPAADKPLHRFQAQFVEIVATQLATYFYKHDPNAMFALDAEANR